MVSDQVIPPLTPLNALSSLPSNITSCRNFYFGHNFRAVFQTTSTSAVIDLLSSNATLATGSDFEKNSNYFIAETSN